MLYTMDEHSYGKIKKKIKKLKNKFKFSEFKQVLRDPKVISYLNILQEQYVMCPIDKAWKNIALYVRSIMSKYSLKN